MLSKSEYKAVHYNTPEFTEEQSQMLDKYVTDPTMNYIFKTYEIDGEIVKDFPVTHKLKRAKPLLNQIIQLKRIMFSWVGMIMNH